ncbi:glycosyltransferase [Kiritimatiellota bacterium B12222]|nr:glycosyltransferase [Kiritimatiellota bacterium B12222]
MSSPRVSILLPVYNSASSLKETLDSLLTQSFSDFELLVVDDGSTDQSSEILAACTDSRLRVLKNPERLRLAGALNRGMREARGELIARMDADDLAHPERLASQVAYLDAHPEIVLCGTWTRHFGSKVKKQERYPVGHDAIRAFVLFNCPFAHPTVMFRKNVFLEHDLFYDGSFYPTEDYELWTRLVHHFPVANLPQVLLDYRVHAQSMTGSDWENMDAQACRLMKQQFADLGVTLDDERIRLHRDMGMARVKATDFEATRIHVIDLLQRNAQAAFCPEKAFAEELRERWFHVCMNVRGIGSTRSTRFADNDIWQGVRVPMGKRMLIKASVMRENRK